MDSHEVTLTVRRERQAGPDILHRQFWKISQDFLLGHPRGQIGEHIGDRDSHPTDAGLTTALLQPRS